MARCTSGTSPHGDADGEATDVVFAEIFAQNQVSGLLEFRNWTRAQGMIN